jgi:hypothetical protein
MKSKAGVAAKLAEPTESARRPEVLTYTVPVAGRMVGLPPSSSYEAAKRGEIPTMRFGKSLRVPKAKWDRMVLGE